MMQSSQTARRIASTIKHKLFIPSWIRSSSSIHRTGDPALHAGETEGMDAEEAAKAEMAQRDSKGTEDTQHPSKPTSFVSPPKVESTPVIPPIDPHKQQKRHSQVPGPRSGLEDVSCAGVDGYPEDFDDNRERQLEEEDDKEYYKTHKASPLSELEFADTRTPIGKAMDYGKGTQGGIILFKEEQMESAEETLMRAISTSKEVAMRGWDRDAPHSRALRAALLSRGDYTAVMDLEKRVEDL